MKMKMKILLACTLSVSAFSFNAFSLESKFCSNPLKTICKDTKAESDKTNKVLTRLRNEIYDEAIKNAKPAVDSFQKRFPDSWMAADRAQLVYMLRNKEIMKSASSRISGLETLVINKKNITAVKKYMKQAIDESSFSESVRQSFKKTIDSVIIDNFNNYNIRSGAKTDFFNQLEKPCGIDGMEVNAFAETIDNKKYVLICPGMLINSSKTINEEQRLSNILVVLAHEIGHHLDLSHPARDVYKPYVDCLTKYYSYDFSPSMSDVLFCQKKTNNNSECRFQITLSHSNELISDQWGIKVLEIHARTKGYSTTQTESLLKNNYYKMCNSTDQGIHPSTNFRIESVLRVNPVISDYLSCNNSKITKPACTFDGENYLK